MKRKLGYVFVVMTFALVFASQIIQVKATTRYNDYDSFDDGYLDMDCQASIWAAPKAGGGYYMDRQYFNVDVDSELGCGIYYVWVVITIQGNVKFNSYVVNNDLTPEWGPDQVYDNFWNYYEYETSNYAVWAEIWVKVGYIVSGDYYDEVISAEASYGS